MTTPLTFTMTEEETDKSIQFVQAHLHSDMGHTAIGGHISYHVTPTSLGCGWGIKCSICGATEDVTDYGLW